MVVVLTGSNEYKLHAELQTIIADFITQNGDSIERFDGEELTSVDPVLDAVRSISFLEPRKLVIVRSFGQNKAFMEIVENIIGQTADSTDLVLIDSRLDKRTTAYKYLQKNCEVKKYDELQSFELEKWVKSELKSKGLDISLQDTKYLVERVGANQQQLEQEIKKLVSSGVEVSNTSINELVEANPQSKVFDMLESLFRGDAVNACKLYEEQRAQGEEPQKLIAMITWQLQQLTLAVFAPNKSVNDLMQAGVSSYSANKALNLASKISKADLKFLVNELAQIDLISKTNADVESALSVYFAVVANKIKS